MFSSYSFDKLVSDLSAGLVVFLVALPLCLGVALASNAPLMAGILSGIVGGLVIGWLSGSHTSISGPSPGLTAVIAAQLVLFDKNFEAFLLAVVLVGLIQIGLGILRTGFIAAFFPSSVVKGLLAAIGLLLILKQIHHVLGHDADPAGDMAFEQHDQENTFSEFVAMLNDLHPGAAIIGVLSVLLLFFWDRSKILKKTNIPPALVVVVLGILLNWVFGWMSAELQIGSNHRVQVPVADSLGAFLGFLKTPDFSAWNNAAVYSAALTLAAVSSLETLLNLTALDKIDPLQRLASQPGTRRSRDWQLSAWAHRRHPNEFGDCAGLGERQRGGEDEVVGDRPRLTSGGVRGLVAAAPQPDPAVLPGGDLVRDGCQVDQSDAGETHVGRWPVPVHSVPGHAVSDRLHRFAQGDSDWDGGEHCVHPEQQPA